MMSARGELDVFFLPQVISPYHLIQLKKEIPSVASLYVLILKSYVHLGAMMSP